jgi:VanZ family protein
MTTPAEPNGAEPRGGFFLNVVPAMLYVVAVFYGGGVRGAVLPSADIRFGDKILHAAAFAGMVFVLRRALSWLSPGMSYGRVLVIAACSSASVGGLLELYQMALPHRSAEWLDFVADALGAALAAGLLWRISRPPRSDAEASAS